MIIPFVKLYTAGIEDADYLQPIFAVLMIITALTYCLRLPYHAMVIAAGHFKQTSVAAYGEALINIVLSVILVFHFDLIGVAIATLIATWYRFIYYIFYLSKNIFCRKIQFFIKRLLINIVTFLLNCAIGFVIVMFLPQNNYFSWALCGMLSVLAIGAATLGINMIFFKSDCRVLIKKFIRNKS